jgi:eukaryotic-like serine/threonine-protein kinase
MTGRRLLQFEVREKIGEGGMGAVYRALDTRLNRLVAIKVLPPEKLADPERKRRFIQEAQTASSLNHPNIITIHDITADGDVEFIVMELVTGRTLAECIGRKAMPLAEVLRCGIQVADALAAAHAAGVIHRDLKPGNIMVTGQGLVKVLDFGLAKLTERVEGGEFATTVSLETPSTDPGTILGTAAYMSPEQAEGHRLDARSDIFSFGAVLYEMLSGQRAFKGQSQLAVLTSVLRGETKPLGELAPGLPAEVDRTVTRCLRKDPSRRFQNMSDLKVVLQELQDESDSGRLTGVGGTAVTPKRRRWLVPAMGAVCLLAAAGAAFWMRGRQSFAAPKLVPLTSFPGLEQQASLSPDGTQVAFAWNGEKEDNFDVYVKQIDGEGFTRLTTDPLPEHTPRWSPDGRTIAFVRGGKDGGLMLIPAIGGPARRISDDRNCPGWTPDSKSVLVNRDDGVSALIFLLSIESGQARQVAFPPKGIFGDTFPAVSPDGQTLAFFRSSSPETPDVHVVPLAGGEPRRITRGLTSAGGLSWTPDGKEIVFSADRGGGRRLWRGPVGASPEQAPVLVGSAGEDALEPKIAGSRLVYTRRHVRVNLWRTALQENPPEPVRIVASTRHDMVPAYSPDGRKIAFTSDRTGVEELWVSDAEGGNAIRLTSIGVASGPAWSPDSSQLVFLSRGAEPDLYAIDANGGSPRRITHGPQKGYYPSWSRDGKWIYFLTGLGGFKISKVPSQGGEPVEVVKGAFFAQESADGRFLLYTKVANVGGTAPGSFWRMPVAGGEEVQIHDAVYSQRWQPHGTGVYFQDFRSAEKTIYFLDIETKQVKRVAAVNKAMGGIPGFTVSPDGRWVITAHSEPPTSDIMLVDNFR